MAIMDLSEMERQSPINEFKDIVEPWLTPHGFMIREVAWLTYTMYLVHKNIDHRMLTIRVTLTTDHRLVMTEMAANPANRVLGIAKFDLHHPDSLTNLLLTMNEWVTKVKLLIY